MAVDFEDITDGCVDGEGIFDKLMKSVKSHLKEEYDAQRIRGSEYTQVYLGGLQGAMSQAIQWQLGAEIAANQAALIASQVTGQELQNELLAEQKALLIAQTAIAEQQLENITQDLANAIKNGVILDAQGEQAQYTVDSLMPAQLAQIEAQILKSGAEKGILDQKLITEEAQTKDVTSQGTVAGMVGTQKALYAKQTDGFDRDAEQKATRIITDTWGLAISSDISEDAFPSAVNQGNINQVIAHLREGAAIDGDA